jgi:hypothetical protein
MCRSLLYELLVESDFYEACCGQSFHTASGMNCHCAIVVKGAGIHPTPVASQQGARKNGDPQQ